MIWQNRIRAEGGTPGGARNLGHGRKRDAVEVPRHVVGALLQASGQGALQAVQPGREFLDGRWGWWSAALGHWVPADGSAAA
jgi:hypothetical protein